VFFAEREAGRFDVPETKAKGSFRRVIGCGIKGADRQLHERGIRWWWSRMPLRSSAGSRRFAPLRIQHEPGLSNDFDKRMSLLSGTTDFAGLLADIVVRRSSRDAEKNVFEKLDPHARRGIRRRTPPLST
jgi:hypothetical protein